MSVNERYGLHDEKTIGVECGVTERVKHTVIYSYIHGGDLDAERECKVETLQ